MAITSFLPESKFLHKIRLWKVKRQDRKLYEGLKELHIDYNGKDQVSFSFLGERFTIKLNPNRKHKQYLSFLFYFVNEEFSNYFKYYIPKRGDVVVDLGGFLGAVSFYMAHLVKDSGHVYVFDPNTANNEFIRDLIELNNLKNITLIKKGVYNENSTLTFYGTGSSGSFNNIYDKDVKFEFDVVEFDSFVEERKLKKIDFIKSDIESAEIEFLLGAEKTIKDGVIRNMAIATYHRIGEGERAYTECEKILAQHNCKYITHMTNGSTPFTTYVKNKNDNKKSADVRKDL